MSSTNFTYFLSTILIVFIILYFYIRNRFSYWNRRKVSYIKPTFPYGNLAGIGRVHASHIVKKLYDHCKGHDILVGIYLFFQPAIILLDPEMIMNVMIRDFNYFHDRGVYYNERDDPLSANLFSFEGHKWKSMNNKLARSFTSDKMSMMFKTVLKISNTMQANLERGSRQCDIIDVKDISARYTIDVIGAIAFGIDCKSIQNPNSEFRLQVDKLYEPSVYRTIKTFVSTTFRSYAQTFRLKVFNDESTKFFMDTVGEIVAARQLDNRTENDDFMQLLVDLHNIGEGEGLPTMAEVAAQAVSFFTSGYQTSSTTMALCLYELGRNPAVQNRLRNEIDEYDENDLTYEQLNKFKYLDTVISETLRLYPAFGVIQRRADRDYDVENTNYIIEKGTTVIIPVYAMHMDPNHFKNPEKFDPDRFNDRNKIKFHPYAYLPYGEGPRQCIGMQFGQMLIKLGLIKFLKKYKISHCERTAKNPLELEPNSVVPLLKEGFLLKIDKLS